MEGIKSASSMVSRAAAAIASFARRGSEGVRRSLVTSLLAGVLAVGIGATEARAQFGMMGGGGQGMPDPVTKRGLDAYMRLLGLTDDQKEAAKALFEGHQTAYRAIQKEMQEKMAALGEKAREDGDFSVYQKEMPAIMKDVAAKAEGLEQGFFNDLKAVCTDAEAANWPSVERYHRREKAMRFGFVSGSAVDLVSVMERIKASPTNASEAKDTLLAYELEIDKILVDFEKVGKEAQKDMMEPGAMFDMKRVETMLRKFYDGGSQVRDVNRTYARRIEGVLGDEDRAKFTLEVQRRSFPRVYRQSYPDQLFTAAMGFADLSKEQKEQLASLKESYVRDAAPVNAEWAKATEAKEAEAGGSIMVMIQGFQGGGGDPNDPVKKARDARKELDAKTKTAIEGVLTPEQKAKLPKKKPEGFNPMADFMPGQDDAEGDSGK